MSPDGAIGAVLTVRPRLRGASHAVTTVAAAVAGTLLGLRAQSTDYRVAAAGYGLTMTALFAVSAAYHRGRWSTAGRRRMKALDHTTIFCFIVGSCAPLAVLVLGRLGRWLFLGSLIVLAVVGVVVKLRRLEQLGGPADVLYGIATWWSLLIVVPIVRVLSPLDVGLLFGGLVLYSLGAATMGKRWLNIAPATFGYHEVAHVIALLGTACHYVVYWRGFR